MKLIDIVIVNWNTGALLKKCIESIYNADLQYISSVIVIDNNSSDDSFKLLPEHESLKLITCKKNNGFGKACNIGAEYSDAPYLLFLNPDTEIEKTTITEALNFMQLESSKDIGICGVQLVDGNGVVSYSCSRFPSLLNQFFKIMGVNKLWPSLGAPMRDFSHLVSMDVDQIIGAFFLIRTELFREHHGFDEQFFMYFDEVDLSKRISNKGYRSYFLSSVKAMHIGGGSSDNIKAIRLFYHLRSRILFFKKNHTLSKFILLVLLTIVIEPITRIINAMLKLSFNQILETIYAYYKLWSWFLSQESNRE